MQDSRFEGNSDDWSVLTESYFFFRLHNDLAYVILRPSHQQKATIRCRMASGGPHDNAEYYQCGSFGLIFNDHNQYLKEETEKTIGKFHLPSTVIHNFQTDGFTVFPDIFNAESVSLLQERLEYVLRGHYDRHRLPDKTPKIIRSDMSSATRTPLGYSGNVHNVKVLQLINVQKCDHAFRKLATHPLLGKIVALLTGWEGVRLAQDQVWAKPPQASQLSFHRDSPYFMFDPPDVVTVWVALDDMDEELGPLEYVVGSHCWGDGRVGSSSNFFDGGTALLEDAAKREGVSSWKVVSMAGLKAGGISVHNGRTWHGSGKNQSRTRPRRGVGLHYIPAHARLTSEASKSRLWKQYVPESPCASENGNVASMELSEDDFPVVWPCC